MLNQLNIIGRITQSPIVRTVNTRNGETTVCNVNVAVNEYVRRNEQQTTFFRVAFWGSLALRAEKVLQVGTLVHVVGRVRVSQYTDAEARAKFSLEVNASNFTVLFSSQVQSYQANVNRKPIINETNGYTSSGKQNEETIDLDREDIKEAASTVNLDFQDMLKNITNSNDTTQVTATGTKKYHSDNETHKETTTNIDKKNIGTGENNE